MSCDTVKISKPAAHFLPLREEARVPVFAGDDGPSSVVWRCGRFGVLGFKEKIAKYQENKVHQDSAGGRVCGKKDESFWTTMKVHCSPMYTGTVNAH